MWLRIAEQAWASLHMEGVVSEAGRCRGDPLRVCGRAGVRRVKGVAHLGFAQQLLELRLWQEAVVLHEGWDLGGPLALVVHGAMDLHVLVQDTQELLLPLEDEEEEMGVSPQPQKEEQGGEIPLVLKSEDVGPVCVWTLTSCVTLRKTALLSKLQCLRL